MKIKLISGATLKFDSTFFDKLTFELVTVSVDEFVNKSEHERPIVNICQWISCKNSDLVLSKFALFFLSCQNKLFTESWYTLFYVLNQNDVQSLR